MRKTGKKEMNVLFSSYYKISIILLVIIMLIQPVEVKAATYQEQLDKGYAEWSGGSVQTLYLRKNQI